MLMNRMNSLSAREHEVVSQVLLGRSNKQIAQELGITVRTVEFHLHNIYLKLEVRSRVELILHLSNTPGGPLGENLGSSTVAPEVTTAEDSDMPAVLATRTSFLSAFVAHLCKEFTMTTEWKKPIANGILWASAIIAAAILGAPLILCILLLPVLAAVSFIVSGAGRGTGDAAR
jgi:DNA-binding CsgD family transcriptional regulator